MTMFNVILIETLNRCTRKCDFCKFGLPRQDVVQTRMGWDLIERIVSNLGELDYRGRISWFWINEPLMEKRLNDILRLTRQHCPNAFLSLITNGDLLSEARYSELRSCGLDALGVSIYDDETLHKTTAMPHDGRLVTLDMRQPAGRLENRAGSIPSGIRDFQADQKRRAGMRCARPFTMLTINPKGQAVLCCSDMYSDQVMGDVKEQRLEEIWNNASFNHYRTALLTTGRQGLALCENCSYSGAAASVFYPLKARPVSQ